MLRIVSTFTRYKTQDFIAFCRGVHASLDGNIYFPNVNPSLVNFLAAVVLLEQLSAIAQNRSRTAILERNSQYDTVLELLFQISGFVLYTAQNTSDNEQDAKDKVLTTYFKLAAEPGSQVVTTPQNVKAVAQGSGTCMLRWERANGTYSYLIQRCTSANPADVNATWVDCGVTTRSSYVVTALTPLTVAAFRVISVGGNNIVSQPSDIATSVVA